MMGAWVNRFCLIVLLGLALSGCADSLKYKFEGEALSVSEIDRNFEAYEGKEVTVEGYVVRQTDLLLLYDALRGQPDYLSIDPGKIGWGDVGFSGHKVILEGTVWSKECKEWDVAPITCGRFITVEKILWID